MNLGIVKIGDSICFYANTFTPSTGAAVDADAAPAYSVYEDETGTAILTGTMALLDDAGSTGFYSEQITVSAANGFEVGKSYCVRVTAAVSSVTGAELHYFQCTTRDMDDLAYPTTSGRSVDVTATGAVGVDWGNVENPTTTVGLSGTTVKAVTDGVGLADDAITSAKFDESTAYPLKAADTGSTYIARTGADSDTLETLSDQMDTIDANVDSVLADTGTDGVVLATGAVTAAVIATGAIDADAIATDAITAAKVAADAIGSSELATTAVNEIVDAVWDELLSGHTTTGTTGKKLGDLDASSVSVVSAVSGSTLNITAHTTYTGTITGLTISASWEKIWFTLKAAPVSDADASAIVQILETNPADAAADGLIVLNASTSTTKAQASLTVDQSAGSIVVTITDNATASLSEAYGLWYDIKQLVSGATTILTSGTANVTTAVTRTIA